MLRRLLPILALALALAGCDRKTAPVVDADPALWVVRDDDTTVYLFGTVHVLKPGLSWFDEGVKDAFDRSDELVLELVAPPPDEMGALVEELGRAEGGQRLSRQLPPATARKLAAALERLDRDPDAVDGYDPWVVATMLAALPVQELGYSAAAGSEEVLGQAAERAGKRVIGLETAREQLGYFDRLSLPAQRKLLIETVERLPQAARTLEAVIGDWAAGNPAALARRLNADLKQSPELEQSLLLSRNRRWADWIAVRMRQPGTVFVAVGAGHLAGDGSVQVELRRRGIGVARVQY